MQKTTFTKNLSPCPAVAIRCFYTDFSRSLRSLRQEGPAEAPLDTAAYPVAAAKRLFAMSQSMIPSQASTYAARRFWYFR